MRLVVLEEHAPRVLLQYAVDLGAASPLQLVDYLPGPRRQPPEGMLDQPSAMVLPETLQDRNPDQKRRGVHHDDLALPDPPRRHHPFPLPRDMHDRIRQARRRALLRRQGPGPIVERARAEQIRRGAGRRDEADPAAGAECRRRKDAVHPDISVGVVDGAEAPRLGIPQPRIPFQRYVILQRERAGLMNTRAQSTCRLVWTLVRCHRATW